MKPQKTKLPAILLQVIVITILLTCCKSSKRINNNSINNIQMDTSIILSELLFNKQVLQSSLDSVIQYVSKCKFTNQQNPYFLQIYFFRNPETMRIFSVQDYNFLVDDEFSTKIGCFSYNNHLFVVAKSKNMNSYIPEYFQAFGTKTLSFNKTIKMYYTENDVLPEEIFIEFLNKNGYYIPIIKHICTN